MAEHSEYYFFLKELFPKAGPELMRLLHGAADNAFLLRGDYYTMRDWLEIAECGDPEAAHAILLLMVVALEEGSLCIEISTPALLRRLLDFVPEAEAAAWAQRIQAALDRDGCATLIGTAPSDHRPVIVHAVGTQRFLYFQKYLHAELNFQRELSQRLEQDSPAQPVPWETIIPDMTSDQPLRLDDDQQLALRSALRNNFTIISGGPGTGKTSIVRTLLRCLIRGGLAPDRIALAAPTGRAAQRLTDALRTGTPADLGDLKATTLHQLLGYRPTRNAFSRHRENPIPADVVIVDEVSMVGLVLMAQLLQALAPATKLVLLGDKDQLPSVEAGAVLAHLVPSSEPDAQARQSIKNVVLLRTNHRSEQQIRAAAEAINRRDAAIVDRLPVMVFQGEQNLDASSGCWLLEQTLGTANELRGFLQHWAEQAYFCSGLAELFDTIQLTDEADDDAQKLFQQLFALMDCFRLLTLVRDSAWGCDEINRFLELQLRPRLDSGTASGLFVGAPVLITRNDSARGLYNGDVGITLRHQDGGLRVLFPRHDSAASFAAESLPAHELGFALTVHKSQGSEYANVMVVLPPTGGKRLLTKELIYTAITRAKSLAVICGTKDVLRFAIGRRIVRESGLLRF